MQEVEEREEVETLYIQLYLALHRKDADVIKASLCHPDAMKIKKDVVELVMERQFGERYNVALAKSPLASDPEVAEKLAKTGDEDVLEVLILEGKIPYQDYAPMHVESPAYRSKSGRAAMHMHGGRLLSREELGKYLKEQDAKKKGTV